MYNLHEVSVHGIHHSFYVQGWILELPSWSINVVTCNLVSCHYNDVIMVAMASQISSLTIGYSTVYSGADQRKHQSSASLAFVRGIHRWPVTSLHKWAIIRKMLPFDDVIMRYVHNHTFRRTLMFCTSWAMFSNNKSNHLFMVMIL